MKKISCTILFTCLICTGANSQPPIASEGVTMYQEVVESDSMLKEVLFRNALQWIQTKRTDESVGIAEIDSLGGMIRYWIVFPVYSQTGILRKLSGKISYSGILEVKDFKYRYRFFDFIFHYYQEGRNYHMVETGKTRPLEDANAPGWQKLWTKHRSMTHEKMIDTINDLKSKMKKVDGPGPLKADPKVDW